MTQDESFEITILDTGDTFLCKRGQNVLLAMERLGLQGIPVGCRGGGCGICRVRILGNGKYRTKKMSRAQVSEKDESNGIALACRLIPEGDLRILPVGFLRNHSN
ncbi:MAG TPA: ferredoxin [Gammaproteobacteria bacterium]|nr:ferredoxin [Gammaproteobacteria bacterium]|tara:strand:- start:676 stop:990 length:315 start_codon:yes stop_codon:yes gene_type:complete